MKKNFLNEVNQMKFLFDYKPGKVISEQVTPIYDIPNNNENNRQQITEALSSIDKNTLVNTYRHYDNIDASDVFDQLFKPQREANKEPFASMKNSCATKVSLALQAAGKYVPPGFKVTSGPMKGTTIQTSAAGLKNKLGTPDLKFTGAITEDELLKKFGENRTGILICAPCGFSTCTGHATVWSRLLGSKGKGGTVDGTTYHLNNPNATINMWYVDGGGSNQNSNTNTTQQNEIKLAKEYRLWANSTTELSKKYGKLSVYDLDKTSQTPNNSYFKRSYAAGKNDFDRR